MADARPKAELRAVAAEDLKVLYKTNAYEAADLDQLGERNDLREFLESLIGDAGLDLGNPRLLLKLLVSIDDYARCPENQTNDPVTKKRLRATTTNIVQAVGVMIRLRRAYPAALGDRQRDAASLIGYGPSDMQDKPHRNLPLYRKKYIEYIEDILTDPNSRVEVLKPLEEWIERRKPQPQSRGDDSLSTTDELKRNSTVLNGKGLYETLLTLYPSYELLSAYPEVRRVIAA